MSRAPLLGLFHELHSQCGNGIPYQAGLMSHNHINIFWRNNLPRRIDHMPYGGIKDSGLGREGLRDAIEEMTEPKLLVMNLR